MTLDPTHGDWIRVLRVNAMCLSSAALRGRTPAEDAPVSASAVQHALAAASDMASALEALDLFNASVGRAEGMEG